jgi:biotin carboxyl carrier protein
MEQHMTMPTLTWMLGENSITVELSSTAEGGTVRIGDRDYTFRIVAWEVNSGLIEMNGRRLRFHWTKQQHTTFLWLNGHYYALVHTQPHSAVPTALAEPTLAVTARMPGTIVQVSVRPGERVTKNQPLLVMESMKMESVLRAPKAATVAKVDCKPGDIVEMGKALIVLEDHDGKAT